jgi:hypothetical protein
LKTNRWWIPVVISVAIAACGAPADDPAPVATVVQEPDSAAAVGGAPVMMGWALTATGAGPVRIGMSVAELRSMLGAPEDTTGLAAECDYVEIAGAPEGIAFMTVGGELVRIDVNEGLTPTVEGARIGDPEARVMELYPSARRGPHKYTDGAYLVVLAGAPADTMSRLVFETDGKVVTRFRGGQFPQVEWVEGCS